MLKNKHIVMIFASSIAAYKACDVISSFRKAGARVSCVLTKGAHAFVTPLTLESLSGERVYGDQFESGVFSTPLHTTLADQADLLLLCPASANLLARLAHGMADDLATSIALATRAPVVAAPAMNDNMYAHPMTQENMAKLKSIGYRFVDPVEGHLVCGREGIGHIASTEQIVQTVAGTLAHAAV